MWSCYLCIDEDNCNECDLVITGLEKIDDETDALDITFVKVSLWFAESDFQYLSFSGENSWFTSICLKPLCKQKISMFSI